jgi:hypothetical protein
MINYLYILLHIYTYVHIYMYVSRFPCTSCAQRLSFDEYLGQGGESVLTREKQLAMMAGKYGVLFDVNVYLHVECMMYIH